MRLAGKVAIVTGAASGIGAAIASRFAAEGAQVVVADIDAPRGESVAQQIGGRFVRTDVGDEPQVAALVGATVAQLGALHVLVSNAGINVMKTAETTTLADWERCLAVDLKGVWLGAKHAIPELRRAGGGSIIHIASMHAFRTLPGCHPYAAAKGGVVAMTRSLAVDHGPDRIRVNAICPGTIETPLLAAYFRGRQDPEAERLRFLRACPIGRLGTPADVAAVASFLAADESAFVTGAIIPVDGGRDALSASAI